MSGLVRRVLVGACVLGLVGTAACLESTPPSGIGTGCAGRYLVTFVEGTKDPSAATKVLLSRYEIDFAWERGYGTGGFAGTMDPMTAHLVRREPVVAAVTEGGAACNEP